ncbi:uncharacterized protein LOC141907318 [Tubulanus polymorphus]|uniref:uncharacterized protein LOC141907318 n=1 Tax=Tubulanus polymorphus TaxID=672921 RepID=UPI003DA480B7
MMGGETRAVRTSSYKDYKTPAEVSDQVKFAEDFLNFCSSVVSDTQKNILKPEIPETVTVQPCSTKKTIQEFDLKGKCPGVFLKCMNILLSYIKEYQQFQNKLMVCSNCSDEILEKQYEITTGEKLPTAEDLQTLLTDYEKLYENTSTVLQLSMKVSPINQRVNAIDEPTDAVTIASHRVQGVKLKKNSRVRLLDNTDQMYWKIEMDDGTKTEVPSMIMHIPPPDSKAQRKAKTLKSEVQENLLTLQNYLSSQWHLRSWNERFSNISFREIDLNIGNTKLVKRQKPRPIKKRIIELRQVVVDEIVEENIIEQAPVETALRRRSRSGSVAKYTISHVFDPQNKQRRVSINQAVTEGIVDMSRGLYINPSTQYSIPISQAMGEGLIQLDSVTEHFLGEGTT